MPSLSLPLSMTLAEIVSNAPSLTPELERLGLDYCCGGKRSLAEACEQKGLDPEAIAAELAALPRTSEPVADWSGLSPAALVDHLEASHHQFLKRELPRLSELAAKVSRVHGTNHPELVDAAQLLDQIRADLEPHLRKEEEVLFPMIRALSSATSRQMPHCAAIATPISLMEQEHAAVGVLLEQLRQITGGYQAPDDTCASTRSLMAGLAALEADTHLHIHKENNHLFPEVLAFEAQMHP